MRVVLDTCVLVAGLRSSLGASYEILKRIGEGDFELAVSVSVVLEYEEILMRECEALGMTPADVTDVVDYVCANAIHQTVFYTWRPQLSDPDDDSILELPPNARCEWIVTHNLRDFAGSEQFGVNAISPGKFLRRLRGLP